LPWVFLLTFHSKQEQYKQQIVMAAYLIYFNEYVTFAFNDCRMLFYDYRQLTDTSGSLQYTKKEWIKEIADTIF
jgi:hypothetical protein